MSVPQKVSFHVVRRQQSLAELTRYLYGDLVSASAKDFMRLNEPAPDSFGALIPGQMLYLPEPACFPSNVEADIQAMVASFNIVIVNQMDAAQRQTFAENPAMIKNAAENPSVVKGIANGANTFASGLVAGVSIQTKALGRTLKNLESRYVQTFKAHGKLTSQFYTHRQHLYAALDTDMGRLSRTLALGTPRDMAARSALKISTKSQVLHWERHGIDGGVKGFQPHFDRLAQTTRYLKNGGYLTIAIDGALTLDTIVKACASGDDRFCRRTTVVESSGFAGRVGGGVVGGMAAYAVCNAIFVLPSGGRVYYGVV
ncbi:hypothetical protein [Marinobacter caseinilyticus]|uniref:hypothetical protein n=1 Tax=Marinobacter caseinilyticus TaxID=2692195 RepID=UPI00140CE05A|nr:hypothetical protein [Marinobacter caseinilyticus]